MSLRKNKSEFWNGLSHRGLPYFFEDFTANVLDFPENFHGRNLKIQPTLFFDLNGLKNETQTNEFLPNINRRHES